MPSFTQAKIDNIRWRLHDVQRGRHRENLQLRHKIIKASYHAQLANEKASIEAHVSKIPHGAQKVFLAKRLVELSSNI